MRKLFSFYRICYCYLVLVAYFYLIFCFYFFSMLVFLFIDIGSFNDLMNDFAKKFGTIVTNKIAEIKKKESDILNADIHERFLNGEIGLKLKQLTWHKEIIITILITGVLALIYWIFNY